MPARRKICTALPFAAPKASHACSASALIRERPSLGATGVAHRPSRQRGRHRRRPLRDSRSTAVLAPRRSSRRRRRALDRLKAAAELKPGWLRFRRYPARWRDHDGQEKTPSPGCRSASAAPPLPECEQSPLSPRPCLGGARRCTEPNSQIRTPTASRRRSHPFKFNRPMKSRLPSGAPLWRRMA
jgi:hypothetical protein